MKRIFCPNRHFFSKELDEKNVSKKLENEKGIRMCFFRGSRILALNIPFGPISIFDGCH